MGRHREFDVDQALDAALGVFWRKGYEGTSYEDLSTATKVSRPGLYSAFGNKQALFVRALDRYDALYMGLCRTRSTSRPRGRWSSVSCAGRPRCRRSGRRVPAASA
ncbi:helix-turn-helix domain-containing protein [Sphingomonas sp. dw_22]|uniref:TetR/AcrR family transcriptional regulator n=1 Tax=Sphingomonas sp. dw_22 TaxID=2721175 RepID=UPI0021164D90|nr:helix-turn-helix domain-containing protein [Sphingomonas sp. dw_22]